jgi:CheY-like chemotaxis protein
VDTFAADPDVFDLAIIDQTMPRMTGIEAAGRILALRPDFPVILYTGYGDETLDDLARATGVRALIRKPVDVRELHRLLLGLLDRKMAPTGR